MLLDTPPMQRLTPPLALLLALHASSALCQGSIDLAKRARIFATHQTKTKDSSVSHLSDGSPETHWHGQGHDLRQEPTNVLVLFREPQTICQVAVTSQVFKNMLRLKHFEVYARVGEQWAGATPLAVVRDFSKGDAKNLSTLTKVCQFEPVRTTGLRIRIRDTWRPDHAWPRICEIAVWPAPAGAEARTLAASAIPGEDEYERLLCEWAMGVRPRYPGTSFDPAKGYLHYARAFVDTMVAKGTDVYGEAHSPMFVSILLLPTQKHPGHPLPCIEGQRRADRAPFGGNLHHDVMLLRAMDYLTRITGDAKYRDAATAYLRFFLEHCPRKETGLFPWGEHAHWDFYKDEPGHATHEYLGGIPVSFWERLWRINPDAVRGEADGLINHMVDLDAFTWSRHANILKPLPTPRPKGLKPADFPRHGGFYVLLWAFVYNKTHEARYLDWAQRTLDHHWRLKRAPLNLPPFTVKSKHASIESAFSLAVSTLEAAALLPDKTVRARWERTAHTYLDSVARAAHRPKEGRFLTRCSLDAPASQATGETEPWTAAYGGRFTADDARLCLAAHRLTSRREFMDLAKGAGEFYASHQPPGPDQIVRAHVYAAVLGLFCDLYDQTGDDACLRQARRYAKLAVERLYWRGLFRGATGLNHYESQMMVSNLVYGLVWLHVLDRGAGVKMEPNYFDR